MIDTPRALKETPIAFRETREKPQEHQKDYESLKGNFKYLRRAPKALKITQGPKERLQDYMSLESNSESLDRHSKSLDRHSKSLGKDSRETITASKRLREPQRVLQVSKESLQGLESNSRA